MPRVSDIVVKTEAIALLLYPFSQHSRVVVWLSPDRGRVVTVIKGACLPKSFFLGQIDTGYRSELLYYARDNNGSHYIRETTPLDLRPRLRERWRAAVAADYLCWLTAQSTEPMIDSAQLYDALDVSLAALDGGADPARTVLAYEFRLLDALGLSPSFGLCADCSVASLPRRPCRFLLPSGRPGCSFSAQNRPGESSVALSPALLAALDATRRAALAGETPPRLQPNLALGVRRFLGLFLCHHLDITPHPRRAAFEWLDFGDGGFPVGWNLHER